MELGEGGRCELRCCPVGGGGESGEEPEQVIARIEPSAEAGAEQCVEGGGFRTGFGGADEEPVLFSDRRWPDSVLDLVVVDFNFAAVAVDLQGTPLSQGIGDSLSKQAGRANAASHAQTGAFEAG